ncbi:aspartate kinase [Kordiimonas sp. SCSIO 12610]|uniref:aspartate kinase n=1 Tax=Kordiimonas sp. SCSIO 12610 TaxID=2829597 RepID=UPI0021098591|nr:aspartate kinase [Kordiimonas sp. SCSIO 12610]UTW55742.1 aspartate kinase [Kordiimonas sp. SCSIO 12610]
MARIVKKFGGTSVGDLDRIRNVATRVAKAVEEGHEVVVVVSAMSGVTNQLVDYCRTAAMMHDAREYDTVVAAGEQITSGLLAITLQDMGVPARSFLGWQIPMITNNVHGAARIEEIKTEKLEECLKGGRVAVVAGFQGIAEDNRITTLGRGGSDTTAVAIAAALEADQCDIYTDVDGIYTTDPRIVPKARKLDKITYEEMLEMASLGAKVLQTRSVALAMKYGVRTQVLSSFEDLPGTLVVGEEEIVEQEVVSGIAYAKSEAKVTVVGLSDSPGKVSNLFAPLADANVNVDMIVQSASDNGKATDVTFTIPEDDLLRAIKALEESQETLGYKDLISTDNVVKVSVVGVGMKSHAGVARKMFDTLAEKGINIQVISTSEIKTSVLIDAEYTELAVRALHTAYGLDAAE